MANTLAKQVTASPAVNAKSAPEIANTILIGVDDRTAERSIVCSVSHSLTKPLSGGKRRNRQDADEKEGARPRHRANDAAETVEIAGAGSGFNGAGADEKQRLVHRVIGEVIERRDERDACDDGMAGREEDHGGADARGDDAHVLDRAVREKTLHLGLDRRVENADQRGNAADRRARSSPGMLPSPVARSRLTRMMP